MMTWIQVGCWICLWRFRSILTIDWTECWKKPRIWTRFFDQLQRGQWFVMSTFDSLPREFANIVSSSVTSSKWNSSFKRESWRNSESSQSRTKHSFLSLPVFSMYFLAQEEIERETAMHKSLRVLCKQNSKYLLLHLLEFHQIIYKRNTRLLQEEE